jgi:hypothetical protein
MSMLEEKIRKNRDLFEGAEPEEGHFDRFQSRLEELHPAVPGKISRSSGRMFRVAAVILVLIGISLAYYFLDPAMNANRIQASALPQEIQEARMYYDKISKEKMQKINECAANSSEASYIQKIAGNEITLLDSSSVQLEQQLQNDKENKRLVNALIRNYKTKSDLLDDILNRLCHI